MKFFLFFTLVAFASAKSALHLLGEEECTRGPGFWCQDYKSAKQCGSVKYCVEHHWKKQLKGTVCDECKVVVKEVHSVLASNLTEVEVIQALEGLCSMMGTYASECKSLIDVYGKEIFDLVKQYTANPDLICKMLGLCSSREKLQFEPMKKIEPVKHTQEPKSSALCIVCEYALTEIDRYLGNHATEEKIIKAVENICSYLPSTIKTECDALISEYGKQIIDLLVKEIKPKEVCSLLKLCSSSMIKTVPKKIVKKVENGIECEACQLIVKYVDSFVKNNKTEEEIKQELEVLCSYLGSYKETCDAIVSEYLSLIIKYVTEMSPDLVCKTIGLCTSNGKKVKMNHIKLDKKHIASGVECSICKFATTYIQALLKNKKTQADIENEMKTICSYFGQYKDTCVQFVNAYTPLIIEYLDSMTPDEICKKFELCTSKTLAFPIERHIKSKNAGTYCETCKVVVGYVDSLLKNQKTEAEIVSLVEKFCSYLGTYKDECDSLVAAYLPEILSLLAQELSPDLVCKELGLCTAKAGLKISKPVKVKKAKNGIECEACKLIVTYADKALKSSKTKTEIESIVKEACSLLGTYKDECVTMVDAYLPEILNLLAQELSPDLVCKTLGLCTSKAGLKISKAVKVNNGASCELCEIVVSYVDKLLDNSTEAEITAAVEKLCSYLGSYSDECKSLVGSYLPEILKLLKQELKPAEVCKELGLCTAVNKFVRKVATSKAYKNGAVCTLCEMLVVFADKELKDAKTEAEITKELEQVCNYLQSYKAQCDTLVEVYLPLILKYLAQEMKPAVICKTIGLCPASTEMFLMKKAMPLRV